MEINEVVPISFKCFAFQRWLSFFPLSLSITGEKTMIEEAVKLTVATKHRNSTVEIHEVMLQIVPLFFQCFSGSKDSVTGFPVDSDHQGKEKDE